MEKKHSKRMKKNYESVDDNKIYDLKDACAILKNSKQAKFVETVDIAIKLGIDSEKQNNMCAELFLFLMVLVKKLK